MAVDFEVDRREDGTVIFRYEADEKNLRAMGDMFYNAADQGAATGDLSKDGKKLMLYRIIRVPD